MKRPTHVGRPARAALRLTILLAVTALVVPGCGKKGPPLPPLVRVPARPETFVARRLGPTVYLQVKIPALNGDGTSPANVERVDVYGYTGAPEGNDGIFKEGMLVASIPVRRPPEPETAEPAKGAGKPVKPEDEPPAPPRPPPSMENGFDQGDLVVVTETLGPAQLTEVVPRKRKAPKVPAPVAPDGPRALGPAPRAPLPARIYVAVGVNRRGQKGAVSGRQSVLLMPPASAPGAPEVTYSERAFTLSWTPPPDAQPPAPGTGPAALLKGTPIGTLPITGAFNVYEVPPPIPAPPGGKTVTPPSGGGVMPAPLTPAPVPASPLVDARMEFGKPRCYVVRAVTMYGTQAVEGEASPPACVMPADTFAPAAPASLKAVGSEGAVSLVWDAGKEADLAGYLVMRAAIPGGEFAPVTREPVKEATFTDMTAGRGVRYAYVVVAVDTAGNRSLKSNQVEEAAR